MKKKVFLLLVALCLVAALVVAMAACGEKINGNNNGNDNGNNGNNGNQVNGGDSFDYQAAAVNAQLEAMRQGNGYLLKYNVSATGENEASTIAIGAKGDIYYLADDDQEYYYDVSNADHMDWYEKNGAAASWEKTTTNYSEFYTRQQAIDAMQAFVGTYSLWMTYYKDFESSMGDVVKYSATVAGRECDDFTFSAAALTGEGLNTVRATYSCYVDKATSICLKWEYSATVNGKTETWTMECTTFDTNPNLTLPTVSADNTHNYGGDDQGNTNQGGDNGNQGKTNQGGDTNQGGENGNTNQGGDNGNTGDGSTVSIADDYPNANSTAIVDALIRNGFRVTYAIGAEVDANGDLYKASVQDTYTFAAKSEKYYIISGDSEAYFDFGESDEYYMIYSKEDGQWTKTKMVYGDNAYYTDAAEAKKDMRALINNYMTLGNDAYIDGLTKVQATYLRRDVDKYTKQAQIYGMTEKYIICIDKETGVELMFYHGIAGYGTASNIATEFVVNYDVVLPEVADNTNKTIAELHDPDRINVLAAIKKKAYDKGIVIQLSKTTEYSKTRYELNWLGDKIQYTQSEEEFESGDTLYYEFYLIDASGENTVDVYKYVGGETADYVDELGAYYTRDSHIAEEYNYGEFSELIYVLSNYSEFAYTPGVYQQKEDNYTYDQPRKVDVYTINGNVLIIDVDTDALLSLQYAEADVAYIRCDEIRYDLTNIDITFPTPVEQ